MRMKMLLKYFVLLFVLMSMMLSISAQELKASFTLDYAKVESPDRSALEQLNTKIKELINNTVWTKKKFAPKERIDCSIGLKLSKYTPATGTYSGELSISARRPVFNSTYNSPILNYRDNKFEFDYMLGEMLNYAEIGSNNNLVSTIVFYVYIILGLDADSFALNGGKQYFQRALEIASAAQSTGAKGWEAFDDKSRYDLALSLTEDKYAAFHQLWYNYHRLALDEMAANPTRSRLKVVECLNDLETIKKARTNSILLSLFAETKLDEFVKICEQSKRDEKQEIKARLLKLFPAKKYIIDELDK